MKAVQWTGSAFLLEWGSLGNRKSIKDLQETIPAWSSGRV